LVQQFEKGQGLVGHQSAQPAKARKVGSHPHMPGGADCNPDADVHPNCRRRAMAMPPTPQQKQET
jgi:hypothetical protein